MNLVCIAVEKALSLQVEHTYHGFLFFLVVELVVNLFNFSFFICTGRAGRAAGRAGRAAGRAGRATGSLSSFIERSGVMKSTLYLILRLV